MDFCLLLKMVTKIFKKNRSKNLSGIQSQKLLDNAKQSSADAPKTACKRPIQERVKSTEDLIWNNIGNTFTKKSPQNNSESDSQKNQQK